MDLNALLEKTLAGLGYELVDLEMSNRGRLLRVFIDKPAGITVDDCAEVSHHLSHLFAVEMDLDYDRLEVSSPGLDRPLKKAADFQRYAGQVASVKLRVPMNGRRNFEGVLKGLEEDRVKLEVDGTDVSLELANVSKARLVPRFK